MSCTRRILPIDMWQFIRIELLRYVMVALVLLVPLAFWSRNHWREVQALAKVTERFGSGDLAARANTPVASSVYPLSCKLMRWRNGLLNFDISTPASTCCVT